METKQNDKLPIQEAVMKENNSRAFTFWKWKAKYFAWSYILCVPIFALIYAQIPNDFYHTTVKYERESQELMGTFSNQLGYEAFVLGKLKPTILQSAHDASILKEYEDYVDTYCNIGLINNFEIIGKQLKFDAVIGVKQYLKKDLGNKFKAPFKINFLTKARLSIDFSKDSESRVAISEDIKSKANELLSNKKVRTVYFDVETFDEQGFFIVENLKFDFAKLAFNKHELDRTQNQYFLHLSEDSYQKATSIYNVLKGFPSDLKGGFLRHLYLSATTITTLGLGDIYPITSRARALITIETLLGIIFTGLFLNAIARANNPS